MVKRSIALGPIRKAAGIIGGGGLVVYPTETVYGLGGNIFDKVAVLKVFEAKNRPLSMPLSAAVKDMDQMSAVAFVNDAARALAEAFLPGPLTVILRKRSKVPRELTSGMANIGIRMPDNEAAQRLIEMSGPITATSANITGRPSPRSFLQAKRQMEGRVDFMLDGGRCRIGKESTIVDVSRPAEGYKVVREGVIPAARIMAVLKKV